MQVGKKVCRAVWNRESNVIECSEVIITKFNEDSSGSQCKLGSKIQRAGKGAEKEEGKTSGSQRSWRIGSGENFK